MRGSALRPRIAGRKRSGGGLMPDVWFLLLALALLTMGVAADVF